MPPIPLFCNGSYQAISPIIDGEVCMNLFCERAESPGARSPIALLMAPGKTKVASLPEAGVTSQLNINGRGFVAGSQLYELDGGFNVTIRGSLGLTQPLRPCQMFANETQVLCLNNGNLYVFTLATNVLTAVNMAQLQGGPGSVMQIDFADGYFFAWFQNTHTFQQSRLEDGTTWSGLDVATASIFPDNFVSMKADHREVWFLSAKKSAGYYNSGAGFPTYIPIQAASGEFGAGATSATVQADNTLAWIGADERGPAVAYRLNGYTPQRISTFAVEQIWQSYSTVADARAYSYEEKGHVFWVVYFPSGFTNLNGVRGNGATWAYDFSTQLWAQRGYWNVTSGTYDADHSQSHMFFAGKHLVGDWASGNIYEQSTAISTDNAGILRWLRRSPTTNDENHFVYFSEFEADLQVGVAPQPPLVDGNGNPRPAQVQLRWSNDSTRTWSSYYILNCGAAGEFNVRARKTQLGRARKRAWELSGSDPVGVVIVSAYAQAQKSLEGGMQ